jgi:hypothetical protein
MTPLAPYPLDKPHPLSMGSIQAEHRNPLSLGDTTHA